MTEERPFVVADVPLALRALIEGWLEAERSKNAPGAGDGGVAGERPLCLGDPIEGIGGDLEEIRIGIVLGEAEDQLGHRGRPVEAGKVVAYFGAVASKVEAAERVEVPSLFDLQLSGALHEEI